MLWCSLFRMTGFSEDPAPFGARLDKAAFFAWAQAQDGGRFELKDGHIVMHAGSTNLHALLAGRFVVLLGSRLDLARWAPSSSDFAVEIGDDVRYPDVVVVPMTEASQHLGTDKPALLIEVLSPSSVERDMHLKLAEYTSLPSLQAYIVASQEQPLVWLWQRDEDTGAFPAQPVEISGMRGEIALAAFGVTLPLSDIYRGLVGEAAP